MDFMADSITGVKPLRVFNVIDDFNRELLGMDFGDAMPAERVIRSLDRIIEWRGKPKEIRCDNGPEYISKHVKKWADERGIILLYIQPGNPQQNAYVERFNKTVRLELLEMNEFTSLAHASEVATKWQWMYNNERPNMGIGGITPQMKLNNYNRKKRKTIKNSS